jgi:hypothetical protein
MDMTVDKFVRRNQIIADRLTQLRSRGDQMHWDGLVHPVNPQFRDVLQAQERLLNALERLLDNLPALAAA